MLRKLAICIAPSWMKIELRNSVSLPSLRNLLLLEQLLQQTISFASWVILKLAAMVGFSIHSSQRITKIPPPILRISAKQASAFPMRRTTVKRNTPHSAQLSSCILKRCSILLGYPTAQIMRAESLLLKLKLHRTIGIKSVIATALLHITNSLLMS